MPRARKTTGVAKRVTRTKRARRTRRTTEDSLEEAGMGGSDTDYCGPGTRLDDYCKRRLDITICKILTLLIHTIFPKCPKCSSILTAAVVPAGQNTSLLQCSQCSTMPLCEHCLYPCPDGTCTNQACHIVSLLLTCDRVKETSSNVYGCPLFRACPKCHNLISHVGGCKYVRCDKCSHGYCFICLRASKECRKDKDKYFSLTCSVPKAARQRFQT
ncbi:E3 ubiquitin-protein ligase ARIH2-like [Silurus asotus]|uniref:E3 ubiquitin-protein ligase ARIH2-like n=1 Tax=Silurus asotus TaxID=30991 RepID=A0AAD5A2J5_SILAS|nr:E3 ubiquitin-protein ligase ARIH2-like [Silurus asotus]